MRRRRSLSWLVSAGRGAAAVSVVAALLAARPGPATAHDMTAYAASPPPAARYNVAATHSPRLRQMLSGAGPATGEQSAAPSASQTAGLAQGIDVASFQHNGGATIDWSQVAAAGYTFAFVKSSEGSYYVNPYYASDTAAARKAGLLVAAYHFAIPNDSSATLQADLAANAAGDPRAGGATLPLILDIEYDPYVAFDHTNSCYGLTPAAMTAWLAAFIAEAQRRDGTLPVIYTTAGWWNTCTGSSAAFSADPLWIASSGTSPALPAGWTNWSYWQYTSAATVPGIPGKVDVSYLNSGVVAAAQPQAHSGAADGTIQLGVRSLAAAAGETMTYSAGGLPPGLSIDPASGVITGSLPSTPASYPVTVTLSAGGEAQAVRFTWYVHGPVSLTHPGTQNSTAGSAVDLQLGATDGLSGCSANPEATASPSGQLIPPASWHRPALPGPLAHRWQMAWAGSALLSTTCASPDWRAPPEH
jgi:GH25 family lysozyme M1 (1,4-beta-N-acetylmuramidase)